MTNSAFAVPVAAVGHRRRKVRRVLGRLRRVLEAQGEVLNFGSVSG